MSPRICFALLLLASCLLPAPRTGAQEIHTCVDARGLKSYQNQPCVAGQRTASVRSYEAKPDDPALAARSAAIQQEMDRRNRGGGKTVVARAGASRRTSAPTPCQAAKAKRDSTRKRVGLKRTYELMRQLDSDVWEACKGGF